MNLTSLKVVAVVLLLGGASEAVAQRTTKTTKPLTKTAKAPTKAVKAPVKRGPKLELPVVFEGACQLECCKYGPWHSTAPVMAFAARKPTARVAFRIDAGETVRAISGSVFTVKPGIVVMRRPDTIFVDRRSQRVPLALGEHDTLFTVDVAGEATDAYWWYRGKTYHTTNELNIFAVHEPKDEESYEVLSIPKQQWWVRVRNEKGKGGWLINPVSFPGMDDCGAPD
jgi:hypothetical protein